jgi:hypothetical protein
MAQPEIGRNQHGAWQRYVITPKGERVDSPAPHPLAHFTRYPALLNESGDFCYLCPPQKRISMAMAAKEPRAEVHVVGKISGFTIYDVFYRFQSEGEIDWKSVVVRTGTDRYREIFHNEPTEGRPNASFFAKLGDQMLLGVQDNQYRMDTVEEYWCFADSKAFRIDFAPIWNAARKITPANQFFIERPGLRLNSPNLVISLPTLIGGGSPCCEIGGVVLVTPRLQNCVVQAEKVEFQAKSGQY